MLQLFLSNSLTDCTTGCQSTGINPLKRKVVPAPSRQLKQGLHRKKKKKKDKHCHSKYRRDASNQVLPQICLISPLNHMPDFPATI